MSTEKTQLQDEVAHESRDGSGNGNDPPTGESPSSQPRSDAAPTQAPEASPASETPPAPAPDEQPATTPSSEAAASAMPAGQAPGETPAPPESSPSETPAPAASSPPAETPAPAETSAAEFSPSAPASATASASPATGTDSGETPPTGESARKRKLRLNPTFPSTQAKPVPNLASPAGTGPTGSAPAAKPVELPASDDAEVEAGVAQAVAGTAPTQDVEAPSADKPPVEIPEQEAIDASIEAAIEAALAGQGEDPAAPAPAVAGEETESVTETPDIDTLQPGQKLKGTVQSVHGDGVFLDFGLRLSGIVPFRQFGEKHRPKEGDAVEVVFERIDESEGLIVTNLPRGTTQVRGGNWDSVAPDQVVECVVNKTNKGGLEVSVGSLRGFIPASQVDLGFVENLDTYVGQKFRAQIIEVKPQKKRLVLSRRKLLVEERKEAKAELMEELKPDQIRTGRVKTIKEYGAFVDLGGTDGFLPIAQMSWVRIDHPNEVIREGQEIEVKILSIDREKDRISLGMRQLTPNPWRLAEDKYEKGSTVTGRVTRTEPFGAFVELEPGVEGLVHISELDHRRVKRVTEVLNVDDMVEVQVLEVDPAKKRISLSVKALKAQPEPVERPKDEDLAPGGGARYERKRKEKLKGGIGGPTQGGLFGNPRDFS
jgi:predicted RNA-binding protein with RPS1 domain